MRAWAAFAVTLAAANAYADQAPECADEPHPFMCSRADVDKGPSLHWPGKSATFRINDASIPEQLSVQTVIAVIRASFKSWQDVSGSEFQFAYGGTTAQKKVGFDFKHIDENENIVIFQSEWAHDSGIIGLTTATFNAQSGEIFDADIELNSADYQFTTGDAMVVTDVQNTVTHEAGHFIGFDHSDKDGSDIDPTCATTATMSRQARPGETSKRTVWYTDAAGMRYVYPKGKPAQYCSKAETPQPSNDSPPLIEQVGYSLGGCSATTPSLLGTLAVAWLLRRRRMIAALLLLCATRTEAAQAPPQPDPQPALCVNLMSPKPFMCSHVEGDRSASLHWASGIAAYHINATTIPATLDKDKTIAIIRQSFDTWTNVAEVKLTLTYAGDSKSQVVGTDYLHLEQNENLVLFQSSWPHRDKSQDRLVIALTTATFNAQSGEIFDADIELNAEFFDFTISDVGVQTDVQNTVTHEAGHFIGFDHPDKEGSTIPSECSQRATMSARAGIGETAKRALAPTDILGARTVYPVGKPPQYCSPEESAKPPTFSAPGVTQLSASLSPSCAAMPLPVWLFVALFAFIRRRLL